MYRLVAVTTHANGAMGRRAAAQLSGCRHLRPLHAAIKDLQGDISAEAPQPQHELVVMFDDVDLSKSKLRLDAFLACKLPSASRARLQASIKEGLVLVNGRQQCKASYGVKPGDTVACSVLPPPPLEAAPEALALDIVYEDEHLIVINKAADTVMHPSPGHYSGTLVNALLHHCRLPAMSLGSGAPAPLSLEGAAAVAGAAAGFASSAQQAGVQAHDGALQQPCDDSKAFAAAHDAAAAGAAAAGRQPAQQAGQLPEPNSQQFDAEQTELEDEDDDAAFVLLGPSAAGTAGTADGTVRPGIVHRLDKGTTGLVVVAKTDAAHMGLAQQFKDRTVRRTYVSVTLGVPRPPHGRVATNVGRDMRDRKKMAAFAYACTRGRTAASNYAVLEVLAGGAAALVEWRLETGRTHQIRVHAKHLGHPLFADDTYSSIAAAGSIVGAGKPARAAAAQVAAKTLGRPALHAKTLGFVHPVTGRELEFDSQLPEDLQRVLDTLRAAPFA